MVFNLSTKYSVMDGRYLLSKYHDFKKSEQELNENLTIIKKWAFQWKMDFNPEPKNRLLRFAFLAKS